MLVGLTVLGAYGQVFAAPSACSEEVPSDVEVRERLAWIERRIDEHEDDVRRWFTAFIALHAALAGVNLTLAISAPDDRQRIDTTVNAISSSLGLLTLLLTFPPLVGAGDAVRALPRQSADDRLRSLRTAEARLRRSADTSSFVRSEWASLLSAAYVEVASLTLLVWDRALAAVIHAVGGAILGQGRLLLHPTGIVAAWRRYRAHYPDADCDRGSRDGRSDATARLWVAPAFLPGQVGLTVGLHF